MCYYIHLWLSVIVRIIRTITDCQNLQDDLNRLVQWADRWQMSFNFAKCGITNRINPVCFTYQMKEHCLNEVSHTKYLGVLVDRRLIWSNHIDYITSKANKVLGFLQRNLISVLPNASKNKLL